VDTYDYWLTLLRIPFIGLVVGIGGSWVFVWALSLLRAMTR
jgi:hypothetical protein